MTAPYERLLELTRRAHALALEADLEGLDRVDEERTKLIATLPAPTPAAAKPLTAEAERIQAEITAALMGHRDAISAELRTTGKLAQTAHGYGRLATPRRGTITVAA